MDNLTVKFDDDNIVTKSRDEWIEQLINKRVYEIDDTDDLDTYLKCILMNGIKGLKDYDDEALINIILYELEDE
jgi:hypothetical protein